MLTQEKIDDASSPWWKQVFRRRNREIRGEYLVAMLRRLAEEQGKEVEIVESPGGEGRIWKFIGRWLIIVASLFFAIHLLAWGVRP